MAKSPTNRVTKVQSIIAFDELRSGCTKSPTVLEPFFLTTARTTYDPLDRTMPRQDHNIWILKRLDDAKTGWKLLDVVSADGDSGGAVQFKQLRLNYRNMVLMVHSDKWCEQFNALATSCMPKLLTAFDITEIYAKRVSAAAEREIGEVLIREDCIYAKTPGENDDEEHGR